MKTMTCRELGGACDEKLSANSFDEIALLASRHGREMTERGDSAHLVALEKLRQNISSPASAHAWMNEKRKIFDLLPNDTIL